MTRPRRASSGGSVIDCRPAAAELGWRPEVSLTEGAERSSSFALEPPRPETRRSGGSSGPPQEASECLLESYGEETPQRRRRGSRRGPDRLILGPLGPVDLRRALRQG
jgi:hypothetical protein